MKKLIKPQVADLKYLDTIDALCENTCGVVYDWSCVCVEVCCNSLCKDGWWADDDKDDVLF
jgi:hypothetical protein